MNNLIYKFDIMKRSKLSILLIFICVNFYSQQFSFLELAMMTKDYKIFEQKMFSNGNGAIEMNNSNSYSFEYGDEGFGSSESLPTNNPFYEAKYKFPDGEIYLESEINEMELDRDYKIRNKLRKEGQPLNYSKIKNHRYVKGLTVAYKTTVKTSKFGENYEKEAETATTYYDLRFQKQEKFYPVKETEKVFYSNLRIFYVNKDDYLASLKEIQSICEYIETKKFGSRFESKYKYKKYKIESFEGSDYGGTIKIKYDYR